MLTSLLIHQFVMYVSLLSNRPSARYVLELLRLFWRWLRSLVELPPWVVTSRHVDHVHCSVSIVKLIGCPLWSNHLDIYDLGRMAIGQDQFQSTSQRYHTVLKPTKKAKRVQPGFNRGSRRFRSRLISSSRRWQGNCRRWMLKTVLETGTSFL